MKWQGLRFHRVWRNEQPSEEGRRERLDKSKTYRATTRSKGLSSEKVPTEASEKVTCKRRPPEPAHSPPQDLSGIAIDAAKTEPAGHTNLPANIETSQARQPGLRNPHARSMPRTS